LNEIVMAAREPASPDVTHSHRRLDPKLDADERGAAPDRLAFGLGVKRRAEEVENAPGQPVARGIGDGGERTPVDSTALLGP
jgi:hypothetical protein